MTLKDGELAGESEGYDLDNAATFHKLVLFNSMILYLWSINFSQAFKFHFLLCLRDSY